jgi:CheY-like chemotaxis protein
VKILIIDDARFQRGQMARMLGELGHTVIEAVNGQEGYMKLCTEGPDAVVCDLLMPVMDGIAFLTMVQKHQIQTPIIVASADIQLSTKEQVHSLGAKAFLNKPCSLQDLAAALGSLETGGGLA